MNSSKGVCKYSEYEINVFQLSNLWCEYTYMPWIGSLENEDSDNRYSNCRMDNPFSVCVVSS